MKNKTLKIINLSQYYNLISELKNNAENDDNKADFLFRGQPEDKCLRPKIGRGTPKDKRKDMEQLILKEFERICPAFVNEIPKDNWELLAVAQHYGLKTRLLDWTNNASIALWFAVKEPPVKDSKGNPQDAVVWIFMPELDDYRLEDRGTIINETQNETNERQDIKRRQSPFQVKLSMIFRPKAIDRRIVAQSSVFTIHAIKGDGEIVKFEKHKRYRRKLIKVIIPHNYFPNIRRELDIAGINYSNVVPDLSGLCNHLNWRYLHYKDEIK